MGVPELEPVDVPSASDRLCCITDGARTGTRERESERVRERESEAAHDVQYYGVRSRICAHPDDGQSPSSSTLKPSSSPLPGLPCRAIGGGTAGILGIYAGNHI